MPFCGPAKICQSFCRFSVLVGGTLIPMCVLTHVHLSIFELGRVFNGNGGDVGISGFFPLRPVLGRYALAAFEIS